MAESAKCGIIMPNKHVEQVGSTFEGHLFRRVRPMLVDTWKPLSQVSFEMTYRHGSQWMSTSSMTSSPN